MASMYPVEPDVDTLEWMHTNLFYDTQHGGIKLTLNGPLVGWNSQGYCRWYCRGRRFLIHHIVWFLNKAEWPQYPLDHKDQNRTNNKIENLNYTTSEKNARNSKLSSVNKTGFKGVFKVREHRYRASITVRGKVMHLGTFYTIQEAYEARKAAENKYWNSQFAY